MQLSEPLFTFNDKSIFDYPKQVINPIPPEAQSYSTPVHYSDQLSLSQNYDNSSLVDSGTASLLDLHFSGMNKKVSIDSSPINPLVGYTLVSFSFIATINITHPGQVGPSGTFQYI
jgi:hypothetical protein